MATIVLRLRGRELSRHPIQSNLIRIGRDVTNDIAIDNPGISRVHASIRFTGGKFHVVDEGSANGIFVNGDEVDTCPLQDNDEIQLGKFTALFLAEGGLPSHQLQTVNSPSAPPVNPVETTSISTADLRRMIAEKQAEAQARQAPQSHQPPQPPQPPSGSHRHFNTYTGPPADLDMAPKKDGNAKTQQMLLLAVGAMGAMVVVLTGLVAYLLLKS